MNKQQTPAGKFITNILTAIIGLGLALILLALIYRVLELIIR
jgi:hypothetical protein